VRGGGGVVGEGLGTASDEGGGAKGRAAGHGAGECLWWGAWEVDGAVVVGDGGVVGVVAGDGEIGGGEGYRAGTGRDGEVGGGCTNTKRRECFSPRTSKFNVIESIWADKSPATT